jgi:Uncharacterised protein family (UPF0158)
MEQRSALRAAVYRGDGRAVVELLGGVGADDASLQLAGDGVIAAVMQRVDGAAELDRNLVVRRGPRPGRGLAVAIRGRGAFRRFEDELARWPGELERWHALSEERQRGRARSWLAAAGYRVLPVDHRDS